MLKLSGHAAIYYSFYSVRSLISQRISIKIQVPDATKKQPWSSKALLQKVKVKASSHNLPDMWHIAQTRAEQISQVRFMALQVLFSTHALPHCRDLLAWMSENISGMVSANTEVTHHTHGEKFPSKGCCLSVINQHTGDFMGEPWTKAVSTVKSCSVDAGHEKIRRCPLKFHQQEKITI